MEDKSIIDLYFERSEQAITETDKKYGTFCRCIAMNILSIREDADECVNDTYLAVWNSIPPGNPDSLRAFLGRITRNLSVSRYRAHRSQKRYSGMNAIFDELSECIPSANGTEQIIDSIQLSALLNRWLDSLSDDDCALFIRRYWFGESVEQLARARRSSSNSTSQKLSRLRKKLRQLLRSEGISL